MDIGKFATKPGNDASGTSVILAQEHIQYRKPSRRIGTQINQHWQKYQSSRRNLRASEAEAQCRDSQALFANALQQLVLRTGAVGVGAGGEGERYRQAHTGISRVLVVSASPLKSVQEVLSKQLCANPSAPPKVSRIMACKALSSVVLRLPVLECTDIPSL